MQQQTISALTRQLQPNAAGPSHAPMPGWYPTAIHGLPAGLSAVSTTDYTRMIPVPSGKHFTIIFSQVYLHTIISSSLFIIFAL